jgi:hypothetical protein
MLATFMLPVARFGRSLALGFALAMVAVGAAPASAQSIEDARQRWFDADFEGALGAFEAVLASPALTSAQALDAHRYVAVLALALGREAAAQAHADAAVALDPEVTPPEGAPEAAEALFRMAQRRQGGHPAALSIDTPVTLALGAPGRVVAHLEPSPAELIGELRLRCGAEEAHGPPPSVELAVLPREALDCVAEARTAAGAILFSTRRELTFAPPEVEVAAARPVDLAPPAGHAVPDPAPERRRKLWPWLVGASVLAAAAVGVTVGVVVGRRSDEAQFGGTTVVGW